MLSIKIQIDLKINFFYNQILYKFNSTFNKISLNP
jgi:hypothetical protein